MCRMASDPDHLADLHEGAVLVEVSGLSVPQALLPRHLRNPCGSRAVPIVAGTCDGEEA